MKTFTDPHAILARTRLVDNFLEFVRIDTQSDATTGAHPSTAKQLDLQRVLQQKLLDLGLADAAVDRFGYLYATLPGNVPGAPAIGLIAHVDTATDFSGTGVTPLLHEAYAGGPITLPGDTVISPADTPELDKCHGDTIITASGDTLLGADDKAGVAAILAAIEILVADPTIPRPTLRIAFTPDEEIGEGAQNFNLAAFAARCAYTVDGGFAGEVNFETFSADKADVTFTGVAVHPGVAKGKLVNALLYLGRFLDRLPRAQSPEETELRQGYYHATKMSGTAAQATVELILRDFDNDGLAARGATVKRLAAEIAATEPRLKVEVKITEQYRNMADKLADVPATREHLLAAVRDAGLEPDVIPIRGGTDGSGLTAQGLPTPNIFAGGLNYHGPREWISTRALALVVCTLLNLVQRWAETR